MRWFDRLTIKGFSLFELTIVIALISFIALISLEGFSWYDQYRVHQELDHLYTFFCTLSLRACAQQKPLTITLADIILDPAVTISQNTFVQNRIIFFPDGKIQPGSLYLTDTQERYLYALTIPVGQVSYIRRYRYDHHRWVLLV